jgi:hypothetical protein
MRNLNLTNVFAEWPEGIVELGFITEDEQKKNCIKLTRAMHGGVDVPRLFMKTLCKYLTESMEMVQSLVDPCLYYWKNSNSEVTLMAVVNVDNVLILMGTKNIIEKAVKAQIAEEIQHIGFGQVEETLRCVV